MANPYFSVIVPVYNVEKYLRQCVDSILNQSFTDFELILVDDGSPDDCPAICDEYAQNDDRIRVIHKKNGGLSSARNAGLKEAYGKYILFCDSDDFYLENAFSKISAILSEGSYDVICFGHRHEILDGVIDVQSKKYIGTITDEMLLSVAYAGIAHIDYASVDVMAWSKVYKESIIREKNLWFDETMRIAEDISFNIPYFAASKTIYCMDDVLYYYRLNRKSLIHDDRGFSEKGMERSVYFLSRIQRVLETRIPGEKLYPIAKNRYNRLVIDACSSHQKRKCSVAEMFCFIRNCCRWHYQYLKHYDVMLPCVSVCGRKAKLEELMVRNRWTLLIWLYTKAVHLYHSRSAT